MKKRSVGHWIFGVIFAVWGLLNAFGLCINIYVDPIHSQQITTALIFLYLAWRLHKEDKAKKDKPETEEYAP